ncbi:MAG: hypothetical protein FWC38_00625 [Proteobacteria bacterium]|nr:hypothetical protein [Pseudomonadota bacterium]MCL2306746.1 hypothetical protein [Pseudomonadota bacterium]
MSYPVYPNIPIGSASGIVSLRDGRSTVTTTDGTVATTLAHENEKYNYRLIHSWIEEKHWTQLTAFYEANRYTSFIFEMDGQPRVWKFKQRPTYAEPKRFRRTYTVELVEV